MRFKKSSFDLGAMLYYVMVSIFILVFGLFVFLFVTNGFTLNIVYTPRGVESSILVNRVIYSSNCFTYYDPDTLRAYPSIFDMDKFTQDNFENCLNSDKIVSLILKDKNDNIIKQLNNKKNSDWTLSGEKLIFIYDNGLKEMKLDIRLKDDS
jgi:hypothetical protein